MPFPFRDLPVQDLEGATRNFEQLSIRGILGEPGEPKTQTRELAKAYRPSFSRPVFVTITLRIEAAAKTTATAEVKVGPTETPSILLSNPSTGTSGEAVTTRWPITIALPPNWFYEVKQAAATVTIEKVFEQVV